MQIGSGSCYSNEDTSEITTDKTTHAHTAHFQAQRTRQWVSRPRRLVLHPSAPSIRSGQHLAKWYLAWKLLLISPEFDVRASSVVSRSGWGAVGGTLELIGLGGGVLKTGKRAQGSSAGVQLPSIWRLHVLPWQTNEWRPGTAQFILMPRWEQCHWLCSESQDNCVWFMTASLQRGLSPLEMLIYKSQKLLLSSIVSSCGFIIFFSRTQQDQKTKLVFWLWCGINPGVGSCFFSLDELSLQMGVTTSPLPSPS